MTDWASFSLGLAVGGIGSLVTALVTAWWRRAHYQEPIWKNRENEDAPVLHLEE